MMTLFNKALNWLLSLGADIYLHIIAGLIIAAFCSIVLAWEAPLVLVLFVAFGKECFDHSRYGVFNYMDLVATLCGGAIIQFFTFFA